MCASGRPSSTRRGSDRHAGTPLRPPRTALAFRAGDSLAWRRPPPSCSASTSRCGRRARPRRPAAFAPNAFIRIDGQGDTTLVMPQVEMGQGTYTSISMILAEELDADWSRVRVEHAPPDEKLYANPMLGMQATGNSNSIRAFWTPLRKAGAGARACLVEAAAGSWAVPVTECRTENGEVIHDRTARKLAYGALVGRAAAIKPPPDPPLKDPAAFRLIGRPLKRLDTPDKTNGAAKYGIDAMPPGREVRHPGGQPGARRDRGARRRQRRQGRAGRSADRRARRSGGRGRRPYVGRQVRARRPRHQLERRGQWRGVVRPDLVATAPGQRAGRRGRQAGRRRRQGARAVGRSCTPRLTRCRCWPTPAWNR